jgi:hypothetical protein
MLKKLRADAISTAPWVATCPGLSAKALAFVVYHGGGCPEVQRLTGNQPELRRMGTKKLLREILNQYGRRDIRHEAA